MNKGSPDKAKVRLCIEAMGAVVCALSLPILNDAFRGGSQRGIRER